MRNPSPITILDWIAASLRWLTLLGMVVALATSTGFSWLINLALLEAALLFVVLSVWSAFTRKVLLTRLVSVAADMAVAYSLFYSSGGLEGGLAWAGLLPLLTASVYFQWKGALLASLVNLAVQGGFAVITTQPPFLLVSLGVLAALYLGLGLPLGFLSQRMEALLNASRTEKSAAGQNLEQAERERRRAIYNLISGLSSSLNYQRVLDTALDLSANALAAENAPADRLVSAVLLFSKNGSQAPELHIGSARRFTSADMRMTLPGNEGLIGQTIDSGLSQLSKDPANDPELRQIVALRACKSAYCLPLRTGLDTYGVLLFAHEDAEFFTSEYQDILDIVGSQAMKAIQNARLYQDLEQEKERMMEIQEEARNKMARDLHDGPTQSVAAIAMRVNFARRLMDRDPKAAAEELFKIEELARRTTKEIRHMLFTLRPLVLESHGLVAALQSMAEKMRETYGQEVIIQADPRVIQELDVNKQGVVFYIAEEAVNNARKHARAPHIWVRLKTLREGLGMLEIEDDGSGFDVKQMSASYENRGSLGMVNMRERTELLNGLLHIDSEIGRGTKVQVVIPMTEEAADRIRRGV